MVKVFKKNRILAIVNSFLVDSPLPSNMNYLYNGGSILGLCLVIQMVSGVVLAMFYTSDISLAFESVEYIVSDVNSGWLLSYVHSNGASLMFIFLYLHSGSGLYYGSYLYPSIPVWVVGVIIFLLVMGVAFLGYVLPWGQMSYWAAQVITSMFESIPILGSSIVEVLWGGYSVDKPTLSSFFSLHFVLPFVVAALTAVHLMILHSHGSGNPLGLNSNTDKIPFHFYFVVKDVWGFILVFLFFGFLVFYFPNLLGHRDNYIRANPNVTRLHIVPEWYFPRFYAILSSVRNKVLGVLLMVGAILVLLTLPWTTYMNLGVSSLNRFYSVLFWVFVGNLLVLGAIGSLRVEYRWEVLGKLCTFFYFFILLVLFPFLGFLDILLVLS